MASAVVSVVLSTLTTICVEAPQSEQNLEPSTSSSPQLWQNFGAIFWEDPHSEQNFAPATNIELHSIQGTFVAVPLTRLGLADFVDADFLAAAFFAPFFLEEALAEDFAAAGLAALDGADFFWADDVLTAPDADLEDDFREEDLRAVRAGLRTSRSSSQSPKRRSSSSSMMLS